MLKFVPLNPNAIHVILTIAKEKPKRKKVNSVRKFQDVWIMKMWTSLKLCLHYNKNMSFSLFEFN